jgi:hypothetical protein
MMFSSSVLSTFMKFLRFIVLYAYFFVKFVMMIFFENHTHRNAPCSFGSKDALGLSMIRVFLVG